MRGRARGAPTQWKGKTSFCRAACAGRDEKSCSSELATTGNRGDRRHPGLVSSWKLWSLGRMPFLVKQETKTPAAGHACNGEGHTSLPIIFCSHELRRKYMDHRFTGDLMKRFRNRLACLLDAKRSLAGHHRQSLSINFLSDRGIHVLEMMMQMTIGWRFENFRFIDIEFNSVQNKKYRIKAYVLQCSGKMRLNIWRTTSSKFSNSIFSKTFFSFFFFRWKKSILYFFTYFHVQNYLLDIEIYNWKLIVFENFLKLISFENEALKEKTIISIYFCM